ncbi:MAG: hypothetical protein AAF577_10810 [Pseudomonadota bacterium]
MLPDTQDLPNDAAMAMPSVEALGPADFLLGPEAFVTRCATLAASGGGGAVARTSDGADQARLVAALRAGRPRLEVARALLGDRAPTASPAAAFGRDWDRFVITDLMARYAPDDDRQFVAELHQQLLGRRPSPIEALEAEFDLRVGAIDRAGLIRRVAALGADCRLSDTMMTTPAETLLSPRQGATQGASQGWIHAPAARPGDGAQHNGPAEPERPTAATLAERGVGRRIVIAREAAGLGLILGSGISCPGLDTEKEFPKVRAGWVLTGPKRGLEPGRWNMIIDLLQPEGASIHLDIVANSGLDSLLALDLVGPACMTVGFDVAPFHHFIEIRLRKPEQAGPLHRLRPRALMLERAG